MQRLVFTNSNNETLTIGYEAPYFLQNLVGLSHCTLDNISIRGYQQDGQSSMGTFLQARDISFSVAVIGSTKQIKYALRQELIAFLNPKETFSVVYTNDNNSYRFTCRVDGMPNFQGTKNIYNICSISLVLDSPFLLDLEDTSRALQLSTPMLTFPTSFNCVLSTVGKNTTIINNGDIEAPFRIYFYGYAENPVVTNTTTGEFIKINGTIQAGEILEINTQYGQKTVTIAGQSVFNLLDFDSKFWKLQKGENIITFDYDDGFYNTKVIITYSQNYMGV